MGFESVIAAPQLTQAQWASALGCFEEKGRLVVIERAAGEYPTVAYAFGPTPGKAWPEDFVVARQPPGVYLLFHSATSQRQAQVTAFLTECLHQAGATGAFEELWFLFSGPLSGFLLS